MRHRFSSGFGLGNPDPVRLDNQGTVNKEFADAAIKEYFQNWEGCDFQITEDSITLGIEPAYQYDRLKLISIHRDKNKSFQEQGKAWGGYGSQITATRKYYGEYKRNCKFTRFVDKWHEVLYAN